MDEIIPNENLVNHPDSRELMMRYGYLIMNADDYGPSDYLNDGIIKGIEEGVINSVSVMVTYQNIPGISDFMKKLDRLMEAIDKADQDVGVGLHLCLNGGQPVTKNINSIRYLLLKKNRAYFKGVNQININKRYVRQAEIEIRNQIEFLANYLQNFGKEVDHLNHHVGFVCFHQRLWSAYVKVAAEKGLPIRSPIGYMKTTSLVHKTGLLSGVTAEGVKKTLEKWVSNLIFLSPHRNITDQPFKMLFSRGRFMKTKSRYAEQKGIWMPDMFNDNYYDEATAKKAINFLQSFSGDEIKEFMLHPSADRSAEGEVAPHGFKKRSFNNRHKELKVLLESYYKRKDGSVVRLSDVIKGKSTIINSKGKELRLKLIRYKDIPKIKAEQERKIAALSNQNPDYSDS